MPVSKSVTSLSGPPSSPAPARLAWAPRFSARLRAFLCLSTSPSPTVSSLFNPLGDLLLLSLRVPRSRGRRPGLPGPALPLLCGSISPTSLGLRGPPSRRSVCVPHFPTLSASGLLLFGKVLPFCSPPAPPSLGPPSYRKAVQVKNSRKNSRQRGANWRRERGEGRAEGSERASSRKGV